MDINDYVIRNAKRGIFLDIGANHGKYTKSMAKFADKVYAFEPHPDNIKILSKAISNFYLDNVVIEPIALSNKNDSLKLFQCPANPGGHTLSDKIAGTEKWSHKLNDFIEVPSMTLDSFCEQNNINNITCIKIDVEAAEQYVLEGAEHTLKTNQVLIALETHLTIDREKIASLLKNYGYKIMDENQKEVTSVDYDKQYYCMNY